MVNFVAKYSIYVITLLFMIICSFLTDKFLTASNLVNILRQVTVYAVLAFGQAILLISGNLDLCAGSTCCLTGILALKAYLATGSMVVAILVGMVLGLVINTFSGLVIAQFNLPSFVATLGMQMAVRGLCYIVTGGSMISQTGPNWKTLGQGFVFDVVPISVIVMLIAAVILWVLLDQTVVGRKFYALGGSREAARACGINLKKYVILAYALSGCSSVWRASCIPPAPTAASPQARRAMRARPFLPPSSAASALPAAQARHGAPSSARSCLASSATF